MAIAIKNPSFVLFGLTLGKSLDFANTIDLEVQRANEKSQINFEE